MTIHSQFSVLRESITEIRANEKVRTFMNDWDFLWPCNGHYADPHTVKRICVSLLWQNEQNSGTLVCLWWACVSRLGLLSLTGKSPSLTVMLPPVSSILFRFAWVKLARTGYLWTIRPTQEIPLIRVYYVTTSVRYRANTNWARHKFHSGNNQNIHRRQNCFLYSILNLATKFFTSLFTL